MELHELHVDQFGARSIRERVPIARALPTVAGNGIGASNAARRQNHGLGGKHMEAAAFTVVRQRARTSPAIEEQRDDGEFHVNGDAEVRRVVLKGANELEAGAIPDVGQARIAMAAEVALQNAAVRSPIEHRAPRLELAHAIRRFFGVQLRHPPVVDVLPAAHRVGEVHFPVVAIVDVGQRRGHASLGHDRVGFAQQRLANQADGDAGACRFDRGAEPRPAGADDEHVITMGGVHRHQMILQSVRIPIEQSRT
jgi:hypothetical protein